MFQYLFSFLLSFQDLLKHLINASKNFNFKVHHPNSTLYVLFNLLLTDSELILVLVQFNFKELLYLDLQTIYLKEKRLFQEIDSRNFVTNNTNFKNSLHLVDDKSEG
jgi:hypothetical protein